jgi:hypothetical protein
MNSEDLQSVRPRIEAAQSQVSRLLKAQIQLLQVVAILQGFILLIGLSILIYWIWK